MNQAKQYYAIYTGEGDGIVIHSTWNNIEVAVNELLKNNRNAKQHGFNNEADAKKFAKYGFDEKAKAILLDNMRLNRKIDQYIAELSENEIIAFVAGSYTRLENQVGYGALIFSNKGAAMPKELCGLVNNTQSEHKLTGQVEAIRKVLKWANDNNKKEIVIYYKNSDDTFEQRFSKEVQNTKLIFYKIMGDHITHYNEARHVAKAGAQGIEKN